MDTIDELAGIDPRSPLAELRRARPEVLAFSQGSHDVLLTPADPGGLSLAERAAAAERVAILCDDDVIASHYAKLAASPADTDRLGAILRHVDLVTRSPRDATAGDLAALEQAGLSTRDIVALSQLIAFVSYQVRVVAALRAMREVVT